VQVQPPGNGRALIGKGKNTVEYRIKPCYNAHTKQKEVLECQSV